MPADEATKRVSTYMKQDVVSKLDDLARERGLNASATINLLVTEAWDRVIYPKVRLTPTKRLTQQEQATAQVRKQEQRKRVIHHAGDILPFRNTEYAYHGFFTLVDDVLVRAEEARELRRRLADGTQMFPSPRDITLGELNDWLRDNDPTFVQQYSLDI